MKHLFLILSALVITAISLQAQHHDLKVNVGGMLAKTPGLYYEFSSDPYNGFGAGINHTWFNLRVDGEKYSFKNTTFVSDYRRYFIPSEEGGADRLFAGAYFKAGGGHVSGGAETEEMARYGKVAVGATVGWKLVSEGGFIFEFYTGGGKNFLTHASVKDTNLNKALNAVSWFDFRFGLTLGYRFL